jgi:hypothetical protein
MEMAAAKAGYDLARAEEEVADKAFLEAETLLKRRQGSIFWSKTNISPPPLRNLYFPPKKTEYVILRALLSFGDRAPNNMSYVISQTISHCPVLCQTFQIYL